MLTVATGSGNAGALANAKKIVIDTIAPTVTGVTSTTANGTYGVGSVITITVGWSKAVVVTGTPKLALNSTGGPAAPRATASGSGTSTLTFTYTVAAGQNSQPLDDASAAALTAARSSTRCQQPQRRRLDPRDRLGQRGRTRQRKKIVIDTIAPTVTGVSSTTANGTYGVGSVITITVGLSKAVVVTGTPKLALNSTGGPAAPRATPPAAAPAP